MGTLMREWEGVSTMRYVYLCHPSLYSIRCLIMQDNTASSMATYSGVLGYSLGKFLDVITPEEASSLVSSNHLGGVLC